MAYDVGFFDMINAGSAASARVIVPMVLDLVPATRVVDVGCGEGAWLSVFAEHGCEITGVDGPHVETDRLLIPNGRFVQHDLTRPLKLKPLAPFELAVSLEVAEHLPARRADAFVADLCALAPTVLFSAAFPKQGGVGHVNEQWLEPYWLDRFADGGYRCADPFRWRLLRDPLVEPWYASNMVLMVKAGSPFERLADEHPWRGNLVHPLTWQAKVG